MDLKQALIERSESKCELCDSKSDLEVYLLPPEKEENIDKSIVTCDVCAQKMNQIDDSDPQYWRSLAQAIWSPYLPVKIVAYRILKPLKDHSWASELIDQIYLESEQLAWAEAVFSDVKSVITRDSNGSILNDGDSVTLIKDLDVKGANFTAKRGTMVKGISLTDDPKFVEGKVKGIRIVLVADYLKKA